ncbi:hypothetical protein CHY_0902 [Carboxydothermus hydrogenoformans Z-2901]|uniref:Uncharacterized protein n=1 Tax=Carboxydothermus hydrogenoformans (strain ATCC BAA-161 / DSM 6008 / Z-2901) TaxID=246194 RepID=Q3ADN3_CARHZ|nr:hypothetical protein CHY_0902 [Carboxydothermus hydrogenoformans Z-2901]
MLNILNSLKPEGFSLDEHTGVMIEEFKRLVQLVAEGVADNSRQIADLSLEVRQGLTAITELKFRDELAFNRIDEISRQLTSGLQYMESIQQQLIEVKANQERVLLVTRQLEESLAKIDKKLVEYDNRLKLLELKAF